MKIVKNLGLNPKLVYEPLSRDDSRTRRCDIDKLYAQAKRDLDSYRNGTPFEPKYL